MAITAVRFFIDNFKIGTGTIIKILAGYIWQYLLIYSFMGKTYRKPFNSSFLFLFLVIANYSFSQGIKGQIVDEEGVGIPYASVFVKELSLGVASNEDGRFDIKIPAGEYNVFFQSLGYQTETVKVSLTDKPVIKNVILKVRYYNLNAVKVSSKAEDPAYAIMRKAIALAPYHQNQVKNFEALVYMKGKVDVVKLSRMVKRMLRKEEDAPKEGEVYVFESQSELGFTAPDKYEQKVLSVRNTFPGVDNNEPMQFIALNLYQPNYQNWISPLAPNAFTHYRFRYMGSSVESDRMIHKIQVTPRRKNQQLLSGTIHIVDNLYCLQSVDLKGDFTVGKFHFASQFAEFNRNLWMPVSHNIDLNIKVMGNMAEINYLASMNYKDVIPSDELVARISKEEKELKPQKPEKSLTPKEQKKQQKIEEIMQKDELTTRDMHKLSKLLEEKNEPDTVKSLEIKRNTNVTVDSLASKRDSTFWAQLRPIPLKEDELKSFQKKDSLIRLAGSDSLRKSQDSFNLHRQSFASAALSGGRYFPKNSKKWSFSSDGISPKSFVFNTVDGFTPNYKFTIGIGISKKRLVLSQKYAYAFSREKFMYHIGFSANYSSEKRASASVGFGSYSKDFNEKDGVGPFINTIYTLAFRNNLQRLFHEQWANFTNRIDLVNGLVLITGLKAFQRDTLENNTDFSFFYKDTKNFSPNIPENNKYAQTSKVVDFGAIASVGIEYTPEYYYRMFGNTKIMVRSRFPTFTFRYNLYSYFSPDEIFAHKVEVGLHQRKELGVFRDFYYSLNMGTFFNSEKIHFADFNHFNTQPVYVVENESPNSFCNLPFYMQSTNKQWVEVHSHYRSAFLALKYLPFFSNMAWKEVVFLSALSTPQTPYYIEIGYGTNEILQTIRVSGHIGYMHNGEFYYGFRIGISDNYIGL